MLVWGDQLGSVDTVRQRWCNGGDDCPRGMFAYCGERNGFALHAIAAGIRIRPRRVVGLWGYGPAGRAS
jgi:hypothetical protein